MLGKTDRIERRIARLLLILIISGLLNALFPFHPETLADKIEEAPEENSIAEELKDGFNWRFKVLGYGEYRQPENSLINYNNRLGISQYKERLDFRPDFSLVFRKLFLDLKPRLNLEWNQWEQGPREGEDDFEETFLLHEWLVRYMFTPEFFVSYGREDLRWGPSYLISPSNPFRKEFKPYVQWSESPAMDYGKIIWIPSTPLSVSIISNVDKGRSEIGKGRPDDTGDFEKQYAFKIDYTGSEKFLSMVPSIDEYGNWKLGFYGGWNASDATLLYGECGLSEDDDDFDFLIGGSYSMEMGPIFVLEYYHNQNGCTAPLHECFTDNAALTNTDILKRENYLLVQFIDTRIYDQFNIFIRWAMGIDDHSDTTTINLEYEINDRAKIFSTGNFYHGSGDSEFGYALKHSLTVGMEYNF